MKQSTKQHISKIFVLLGGISVGVESCTLDYLPPVTQSDFAKDQDEGQALLPLEIYVGETDAIDGIIKFANDIIFNEGLARRFNKAPELVLSEYGITHWDKTSPQIQLILACGDQEIQEAMQKNDFKKYLQLLEEKELLQSDLIVQLNQAYRNDNIMNMIGSMTKSNSVVSEEIGLVVVTVALVAAVVWVAAAIRLAAAVQWAAAVQAAAAVHAYAYVGSITKVYANSNILSVEDEAITLYQDTSKDINTIELGEEEYVSEIRDFMRTNDILRERSDLNTLFQIACGTTEKIIENGK